MNPLHYPDLERCKKLKEIHFPDFERCVRLDRLGFPKTQAWRYTTDHTYSQITIGKRKGIGGAVCYMEYVCPNVMEMLDVIPLTIIYKKNGKKETRYFRIEKENAAEWEAKYNDVFHQTCTERMMGTLPNALADLIFWLHENNYIKF